MGLDRVVLVLEVANRDGSPTGGQGQGRHGRREERNRLLGLPHSGDVAVGIAGPQQPHQLLSTLDVQTLLGLGQEPPTAIERIGLPTAMTEGLVLHPAPALVELGVGRADLRWNGVRHLDGVGEHEGVKTRR